MVLTSIFRCVSHWTNCFDCCLVWGVHIRQSFRSGLNVGSILVSSYSSKAFDRLFIWDADVLQGCLNLYWSLSSKFWSTFAVFSISSTFNSGESVVAPDLSYCWSRLPDPSEVIFSKLWIYFWPVRFSGCGGSNALKKKIAACKGDRSSTFHQHREGEEF